uniref:Pancreatic lipase-related protein 2-like n=1 Tax=Saccoglossus kowalevskii TaxID=10224 RepID=A0ABM0MZK5_SACKO|nr:PREDICTED: pancreatic lipase-related protein 2-like [Saccoglossus kowalevskii]
MIQQVYPNPISTRRRIPNSSGEGEWLHQMKDTFLNSTEDLNVFIVDWQGGSVLIYPKAVANTNVVGAEIDAFVRFLDSAVGYTGDMVHLIGHSLGAHVCGHAGERMERLGRISGTDPAGPSYKDEESECRLDPNDAKFIDVIHVDGDGAGIFDAMIVIMGVGLNITLRLLLIACSKHTRAMTSKTGRVAQHAILDAV